MWRGLVGVCVCGCRGRETGRLSSFCLTRMTHISCLNKSREGCGNHTQNVSLSLSFTQTQSLSYTHTHTHTHTHNSGLNIKPVNLEESLPYMHFEDIARMY